MSRSIVIRFVVGFGIASFFALQPASFVSRPPSSVGDSQSVEIFSDVVDPDGNTAFLKAVAFQPVSKIQKYLDRGADFCAINSRGAGAFHIAARRPDASSIFRLLVDAGGDPFNQTGTGHSCLHTLSFHHIDSVELAACLDLIPGVQMLEDRGGRRPVDHAVLGRCGSEDTLVQLVSLEPRADWAYLIHEVFTSREMSLNELRGCLQLLEHQPGARFKFGHLLRSTPCSPQNYDTSLLACDFAFADASNDHQYWLNVIGCEESSPGMKLVAIEYLCDVPSIVPKLRMPNYKSSG